jgi:hypothetical protein
MGLKGCTTFRPNPATGAVLSESNGGVEAPHCCVAEREADSANWIGNRGERAKKGLQDLRHINVGPT